MIFGDVPLAANRCTRAMPDSLKWASLRIVAPIERAISAKPSSSRNPQSVSSCSDHCVTNNSNCSSRTVLRFKTIPNRKPFEIIPRIHRMATEFKPFHRCIRTVSSASGSNFSNVFCARETRFSVCVVISLHVCETFPPENTSSVCALSKRENSDGVFASCELPIVCALPEFVATTFGFQRIPEHLKRAPRKLFEVSHTSKCSLSLFSELAELSGTE